MNRKGGLKAVLAVLFVLLALSLLFLYLFMPFNVIEFFSSSGNSNFSLNSSMPSEMQFYPNLRYSSSNISYDIDSALCTIKKQDDMTRALDIVQNITILNFHQADLEPNILITCDDKIVVEKDYFVAGEGGPVNITKSGDLNVISSGRILLLKESDCGSPNVAIHELFHALGFNHSANRNNIMYPVTKCSETIGEDIPELINELYSVPSYSDMAFGETSAFIHGRYLDTNITVLNNGLIKSGSFEMIISSVGKEIDKQAIGALEVGTGITFTFRNIRLDDANIKELEYELQCGFNEISRDNNLLKLKIKN
ncbi:MAG: matrixin family metalloprotease [Candidatus Nanoarchaeia archaeon]|nr:matrixin family metalloprotease [Candidatus Nanoarchaeia archaeon]